MVSSINQLSEVKVSETLLPKQFDALWPKLEKQITDIPKTPTPAKQHRPQQEVLEELVSSIRGLDVRFRDTLEETHDIRRRKRRFHPMMMRESMHFSEMMGYGPRDPITFLVMVSFIKDELPWLYELAVDAYHETTRRTSRAKEARERLFRGFKALRHGPWIEMFESKETHMIIRELEHFMHELTEVETENSSGQEKPPSKTRLHKI